MFDTDTTTRQREETETHIFGSGFTSYPWYVSVTERPDGDWFVAIEDPDNVENVVTAVLDYNKLREAAWQLVEGNFGSEYALTGYILFWATAKTRSAWDLLDLDSDAVDCLIQQAVLGEVVYA